MPLTDSSRLVRPSGIYRRAGASGTTTPIVNFVRAPARKPVEKRVPRTGALTPPVRPEPIAAPATLQSARELADAGQLAAARAVCERLLARAAGDPAIYSLLGVVALAEGRPAEAAESFRKALYLDPDHPEALGHMVVICDGRGDAAQAAAFRKRLARAVREEPA